MAGLKRNYSTQTVVVTPTITNGAYAANDVIGGPMEFSYSTHNTGGIMGTLRIRDNGAVAPAMVLYVFDSQPTTTIADNAAFVLADADSDALIATITVGTWLDFSAFKWVSVKGKDDTSADPIDLRSATGSVWVYAKVTGTPTMIGTDALSFSWVMWGD